MLRTLKWTGAAIVALLLVIFLLLPLVNWNFLKGPIERKVKEATGRELVLEGNLDLQYAWPPRIRAEKVRFANPGWAKEPQMLSLEAVEAAVSPWPLFARRIYLPEVVLTKPVVHLEETGDGRRSWVMNTEQKSESGEGPGIGRLTLDDGTIGFRSDRLNTRVQADVASLKDGSGIGFTANGVYKGNAFKADGTTGSVVSIRDDKTPFPVKVNASVGRTSASVEGTVSGLTTVATLDMKASAKGESLDQLFPLIGIALPATHPYSVTGTLTHQGSTWRYADFAAKVGQSDLNGVIEVDMSGKRPMLKGDLVAKLLDFDDLGPLIGTSRGGNPPKKPASGKVLPEIPFNAEQWKTVDADVKLRATRINKAKELPFENFSTHLTLKDQKLGLDPLNFGVAGGQFRSAIALDGRKDPIAADARVNVERISLNKLFPTVDMNKKASVGRIDGLVELKGKGDSVSQMLASANGKAALVIDRGQISNMMMELVGIDLWEMLKFKVEGDQPVNIRCGVFDAGIKNGQVETNYLVLDTEDTKVVGSGGLDLAKEQLDLTLDPQPKDKSLISLRTPIHLRGPLSKPSVTPDKKKLAIKGISAVALGVINPLLAVGPLIEQGPGVDSDCGKLIAEAKATERKPVAPPPR